MITHSPSFPPHRLPSQRRLLVALGLLLPPVRLRHVEVEGLTRHHLKASGRQAVDQVLPAEADWRSQSVIARMVLGARVGRLPSASSGATSKFAFS